jgi:myosin-18
MTLEENTNVNEILSGEVPSPQEKKEREQRRKNSVKNLAGSFEAQAQGTAAPAVPSRRGPPAKPSRASFNKPPTAPPTIDLPDDLDTKIQFEEVESPSSPAEKIYANIDLQLPSVAPPRCLKPRALELKRLPAGDFGFTLRRGTVLERGGKSSDDERKRTVIFAEPGPKSTHTGLLPGDRLIEVNGVNVEDSTREEIIELIKKSTHSVMLKVQPIPELSELSMRSGLEGEELNIEDQVIKGGTLKRSGSIRFKTRQVSQRFM